MDGVLVDTEAIWEHVRRRFVAEHGGTYTDRATRDVMGMSAPEWSRYIRIELHVDLPDEQINDGIVAGVAASLRKTLPLFPGACEAVTTLSRCVPLAVASSSNRSLIDYIVAEAGLAAAFHATVSSEEVPHGKPAPDVYLRAAELLDVAAERCGAIEDSSNGLRRPRRRDVRGGAAEPAIPAGRRRARTRRRRPRAHCRCCARYVLHYAALRYSAILTDSARTQTE